VSNEANKLKPEMFARLNIDLGDGASFIAVPREAVLEIDGKEYVYVAETDGKYARHVVKVGSASADQLRILEGLKPGDRVVIKGAILLKAKEAKG
jgi:cobalt-zinc-cadmium efflux system membrane fusion protein